MLCVYSAKDEYTAPKFAKAFAEGCGGVVKTEYEIGEWAGFGSAQTWNGLCETRKHGLDWWYGDHAYFGRHRYYKITRNAFQHNGMGEGDLNRLRDFYREAAPWKRGAKIIVCPQSDNHLQRFMAYNWLEDTMQKLSANSDREIVIRYKRDTKPLLKDLEDAWCLVTHSSASAIHAIMNGVPAICTADCAASIMSLRDPINIEYPLYPDGRMEWASVLANNQWTLDEIKQGKCWSVIGDCF